LTLSLNVQTGKITAENRIHDADIKDMQLSKDGTHFITASGDRTSKLVDSQDLQVMKEFAFERPANAAAMSPIADHVSHTPYAASLPPCPAEVRPSHLYILLH
jgi:WD40 repeat protein